MSEITEFDLERVLIVDVETGGFKPEENPLLEVAMRCTWGTTDQSPRDFSVMIRPTAEEWSRCMPGALKVNQFTWEELQQCGVPIDEAARMIASWLVENEINNQSVIWVGQNPDFDINFMEHYFGEYLSFVGLLPIERVNVMDLAKQLKRLDKAFDPTAFSGGAISLALGLTPEDSMHRAFGGVLAVYQNYFELKRRIADATAPTKPIKPVWKAGELGL